MGELSGTPGGGIQNDRIETDLGVHAAEQAPEKSAEQAPDATPEPTPNADASNSGKGKEPEAPKGVPTDVEDIFADGVKGDVPVFDVSPDEFNNNMKTTRRRLRFKQGSKAAEYMRKTRYNRPFWIRNSQDGYMRKISRQ